MQISINNMAAINIIDWYNNDDVQKKLSKLPLKIQWDIRKNMVALQSITKVFNTFRSELIKKRNEEWFVEGNGKCEKTTVVDENGNEQEALQVIDKYQDELRQYEDNLNKQLAEILMEENELDVISFNIDEFVEKADDSHAGLDIHDLDIIMIFAESDESDTDKCEEDEKAKS